MRRRTAVTSERAHRESESVEIVWTGPETVQTRFRRTEQALLEEAVKQRCFRAKEIRKRYE